MTHRPFTETSERRRTPAAVDRPESNGTEGLPQARKVRGEGRYYELTEDGLRFIDLRVAREGGNYAY